MQIRVSRRSNPVVVDSIHLAYYILAKLGGMTHLKLQKLIYYVESYHLAYFDQSIIEDNFQAWVHGPVTTKVWVLIKDKANVYDGISLKPEAKPKAIKTIKDKLTEDQYSLVSDILQEFGKKNDYHLECLTHEEKPWIEARRGIPSDQPSKNVISKKTMTRYYKDKLYTVRG